MTATLTDRIMARLADRDRDPFGLGLSAENMADLSPGTEVPVYAYRHELDDADDGETQAFGDDATGLASPEPVRHKALPSDELLAALDELVQAGRIVRNPAGMYRLA